VLQLSSLIETPASRRGATWTIALAAELAADDQREGMIAASTVIRDNAIDHLGPEHVRSRTRPAPRGLDRAFCGRARTAAGGRSLTLDEFALWLNLADYYWTKQGRESIDAVVIFGSMLALALMNQDLVREARQIASGKRAPRELPLRAHQSAGDDAVSPRPSRHSLTRGAGAAALPRRCRRGR
jgi:hypothetical protein